MTAQRGIWGFWMLCTAWLIVGATIWGGVPIYGVIIVWGIITLYTMMASGMELERTKRRRTHETGPTP
jgi:hypothetical protein